MAGHGGSPGTWRWWLNWELDRREVFVNKIIVIGHLGRDPEMWAGELAFYDLGG